MYYLTKVELQTCLCEVAVSVNSRPLTFVGTDVENKPPLTPNHFLVGQCNQGLESAIKEDPENVSVESLCEREQEMLQRQEDFWRVWSLEYLRNLPAAYQKFKKSGNLKVGSVVLIKEDNLPRLKWVLGVVQKLHVGRDGISRSADLKTAKGIRTRAVQRLFNLEIYDPESAGVPNLDNIPDVSAEIRNVDSSVNAKIKTKRESDTEPSVKTRSNRQIKRPAKYNDFVCSKR